MSRGDTFAAHPVVWCAVLVRAGPGRTGSIEAEGNNKMGSRFDVSGSVADRAPSVGKTWRRVGAALLVTASSVFAAIGAGALPAGASPAPMVETWGDNTYGQLGNGTTTQSDSPISIALPGGVTPVSVAAGGGQSLAIGSDNNLYAWGQNGYGEVGNGTTSSVLYADQDLTPLRRAAGRDRGRLRAQPCTRLERQGLCLG